MEISLETNNVIYCPRSFDIKQIELVFLVIPYTF